MELHKAIIAILFYQAEPITIRRLASLLSVTDAQIREATLLIPSALDTVGLSLLELDGTLSLGTAKEASALIETLTKEELSKELSKAALETLSIVLYKGPISRSEIDHIRGVNSTFILRNLLIRGLVEKVDNPVDQRSFCYVPTFQLLSYMGVTRPDELPNYHDTLTALAAWTLGHTQATEPASTTDTSALGDEHQETSSPEFGKDVEEEMPTAQEISEAMEQEMEDDELIADILEEAQAGEAYDDATLKLHTEVDRHKSDEV